MKKVVGKITEKEKIEIRNIYNHKVGLEELLPILDKTSEIYKTAVSDLENTSLSYHNWWKKYADKYKWERGSGEWIVVFKTNEILIEE